MNGSEVSGSVTLPTSTILYSSVYFTPHPEHVISVPGQIEFVISLVQLHLGQNAYVISCQLLSLPYRRRGYRDNADILQRAPIHRAECDVWFVKPQLRHRRYIAVTQFAR